MTTKRDEAMARVLAAHVSMQDARASIESVQALFCDAEEDQDGQARADELETAFLCCHAAAIAISKAQQAMNDMDEEDLATSEDDDEDEGEVDAAPESEA